MRDICIIGGGASGLAAAICAAESKEGIRICILEKKETAGKKLAATGNGKCNLSNEACQKKDLTIAFFRSIGVLTRADDQGRLYPYTMQARDVVYAMTRRAETLGVEIKSLCPAEQIERTRDGFGITYKKGQIEASKILLATGGKAAPQFGTTGDGYHLAKSLGHKVNRLSPVLTGLEVKDDFECIKGIRVRAMVGLHKDGAEVAREYGEVQFNGDGISGICVFNLSRFIKLESGERFSEGMARYAIHLDFFPEADFPEIKALLEERRRIGGFCARDMLLSILPFPLAQIIIKEAEINLNDRADEITEIKLCKLAQLLKNWKLELKGTKGWKSAQCTSGGVSLSEINMDTMESTLVPGLYFSGELIDFDGPCGGFNLQNAWETGIKAGKAMAYGI